mmetsp:Transcript_14476/g.28818  ORF Transcript_14476/g.28818 Transcript_14476/m.28818 type:complete len:203 (+) Transcript_14476:550-1158(+)
MLRRPLPPHPGHPRGLHVGAHVRVLAQLRPARQRREDVRPRPPRGHAQPPEAEGDQVDVRQRPAGVHHNVPPAAGGGEPDIRQLRPEVQPPLPPQLRLRGRRQRRGRRLLPQRGAHRRRPDPAGVRVRPPPVPREDVVLDTRRLPPRASCARLRVEQRQHQVPPLPPTRPRRDPRRPRSRYESRAVHVQERSGRSFRSERRQ